MQKKSLHIISFDNPFPPVYGGVVDVFYKIKALHELGTEIYLHCFVSKIPTEFPELEAITKKVFFYSASKNPLLFVSKIPFSVLSRDNKKLLKNLEEVRAPILFEGLKTTFLVAKNQLPDHIKILRLHNIEQDYFRGISRSETSFLRKTGYFFEGIKYKNYENTITKFDKVMALSHFENDYINQKFKNSVYIPVFHGNNEVLPLAGIGDFAFYHGDLHTADNKEVVRFLVSVFKEIPDYKLKIASGSNEKFVKKLIAGIHNIEFIKLRDFSHLQVLLQKAHITISWSFQKSGTKLKLINSLFNSRYSIINENIIDDKVVSDLCIQVTDREQLIAKIKELKNSSFTDYSKRNAVLKVYMNDSINARLINELIS